MSESWQIIHGDCLSVMRGMARGSVDAVVTDPPYGARRPSQHRPPGQRFAEIVGNDRVWDDWLPEAFRLVKDGGAAYVFVCWDKMHEWREACESVGFRVRSCIVWDKEIHGAGDPSTCWAPRHEMILFCAKGRHKLAGKRPIDIIRCQRLSPDDLTHPYEKPTALLSRLIEASSEAGDLILDPFAGSGATGEASLSLGRRFIGIEIDEKYAAIARRRIAEADAAQLFRPKHEKHDEPSLIPNV